MKIFVALRGNALLRRDQPPTAENQLDNMRSAAAQLARVATKHDLVVTHGNGPQVGLLALQAAAYEDVESYPLDVLGAQTDGMTGYLLEQELANLLPLTRAVTTLMTRVEVDAHDRPSSIRPSRSDRCIRKRNQSASPAARAGPWRRMARHSGASSHRPSPRACSAGRPSAGCSNTARWSSLPVAAGSLWRGHRVQAMVATVKRCTACPP